MDQSLPDWHVREWSQFATSFSDWRYLNCCSLETFAIKSLSCQKSRRFDIFESPIFLEERQISDPMGYHRTYGKVWWWSAKRTSRLAGLLAVAHKNVGNEIYKQKLNTTCDVKHKLGTCCDKHSDRYHNSWPGDNETTNEAAVRPEKCTAYRCASV